MRMEETPEWMESWLQVPFYREKCKIHIGKHPTVYCGVCREEPACEACWNKYHSNYHQHHTPILKVCTASRRAAIEVNEIAKVWDVSGIQIYIINGKKIFHLNPKLDQVTKKAENDHHQFCETCKKKITLSPHSPPNVAFCSIACKFKYNSIGAKNMQMGDDTNNNVASSSGMAPPPPPQNVEAAAKSTQLDDYKIGDVPTPPKNEERNDEVVVQTRRPSTCCELILESCTSSGGMAERSSTNKSMRKRSRKGIPRRAPFQ